MSKRSTATGEVSELGGFSGLHRWPRYAALIFALAALIFLGTAFTGINAGLQAATLEDELEPIGPGVHLRTIVWQDEGAGVNGEKAVHQAQILVLDRSYLGLSTPLVISSQEPTAALPSPAPPVTERPGSSIISGPGKTSGEATSPTASTAPVFSSSASLPTPVPSPSPSSSQSPSSPLSPVPPSSPSPSATAPAASSITPPSPAGPTITPALIAEIVDEQAVGEGIIYPAGIHLRAGELLSASAGLPAAGVLADSQPITGLPLLWAKAEPLRPTGQPFVTVAIDQVNLPHRSGVTYFTPRYGPTTGTAAGTTEFVLAGKDGSPLPRPGADTTFEAIVTAVRRSGNSSIPPNGAVLAASGEQATRLLSYLTNRQAVRLTFQLIPSQWRTAREVLPASHVLLAAGVARPLSTTDPVVNRPQARLALAYNDRTVLIVSLEETASIRGPAWAGGPGGRWSTEGVSLPDLARFLQSLGATEAVVFPAGFSLELRRRGGETDQAGEPLPAGPVAGPSAAPGTGSIPASSSSASSTPSTPSTASTSSTSSTLGTSSTLALPWSPVAWRIWDTSPPGSLSQIQIRTLAGSHRFLAGGQVQLSASGVDAAFHPVPVSPAALSWNALTTNATLRVEGLTARLAADAPGRLAIRVHTFTSEGGWIQGTWEGEAVSANDLRRLTVDPSSLLLAPGQTSRITVWAWDKLGRPVAVDPSQLEWEVTPDLGRFDPKQGTLTAAGTTPAELSPTRRGFIRAYLRERPELEITLPVAVGKPPVTRELPRQPSTYWQPVSSPFPRPAGVGPIVLRPLVSGGPTTASGGTAAPTGATAAPSGGTTALSRLILPLPDTRPAQPSSTIDKLTQGIGLWVYIPTSANLPVPATGPVDWLALRWTGASGRTVESPAFALPGGPAWSSAASSQGVWYYLVSPLPGEFTSPVTLSGIRLELRYPPAGTTSPSPDDLVAGLPLIGLIHELTTWPPRPDEVIITARGTLTTPSPSPAKTTTAGTPASPAAPTSTVTAPSPATPAPTPASIPKPPASPAAPASTEEWPGSALFTDLQPADGTTSPTPTPRLTVRLRPPASYGVDPSSLRFFLDAAPVWNRELSETPWGRLVYGEGAFDPQSGMFWFVPVQPLAPGHHEARLELTLVPRPVASSPAKALVEAPAADLLPPGPSPSDLPPAELRAADLRPTVPVPAGQPPEAGRSVEIRWTFEVQPLAPAGPAAATAPTRSLRMAVVSGPALDDPADGAGERIFGEILRRLQDRASRQQGPDLVVVVGDLVARPAEALYLRATKLLQSAGLPYLVIPGQTELSPVDPAGSRARFRETCGPITFRLDLGPNRLLGLDTVDGLAGYDPTQWEWLKQELELADRPGKSIRRFVIFSYRSPLAPLPAGKPLAWTDPQEPAQLVALLADARQRSQSEILFVAGAPALFLAQQEAGIPYLVTGGGGKPLAAEPEAGGFYHWLELTLPPDGPARWSIVPLVQSLSIGGLPAKIRRGTTVTPWAVADLYTATRPPLRLPIDTSNPSVARRWSVDDERLASIDPQSGRIIAKAPGRVRVSVEVGGVTASAVVEVTSE